MTDQIRVLVVDDHPVFRLGMTALIDGFDGMAVVGEADDADRARTLVVELLPDVVIMDVQLPDASGIEATAAVLAEQPGLGVLMLTMFDDDDSVHAAMRAGARGYLVKGAGPDQIERAIRAVAAGEVILGAASAHLGRSFARNANRAFPALSEREEEVLDLVARGLDNAAIARRLTVSDKTVRNHVSKVFTKLGATSRAEIVARARDAGLGGDAKLSSP